MMKKYDLINGSILFLFGLAIVLYSPEFGIGSMKEPGPGFMPFLAGLLICTFSVVIAIQALLNRSAEVKNVLKEIRIKKLVFVLVGLLLYNIFIVKIGFVVCSLFLMLITIRYGGSQSWTSTILVSVLGSVGSYVLFDILLGVPLPRGILGFLGF